MYPLSNSTPKNKKAATKDFANAEDVADNAHGDENFGFGFVNGINPYSGKNIKVPVKTAANDVVMRHINRHNVINKK